MCFGSWTFSHIYGTNFCILSDHKPLEMTHKKHQLHRKGYKAYDYSYRSMTSTSLKGKTKKWHLLVAYLGCQKIMKSHRHRHTSQLFSIWCSKYCKTQYGWRHHNYSGKRIIIPEVLRLQYLEQIHHGHQAQNRCLDRAKICIYFTARLLVTFYKVTDQITLFVN